MIHKITEEFITELEIELSKHNLELRIDENDKIGIKIDTDNHYCINRMTIEKKEN